MITIMKTILIVASRQEAFDIFYRDLSSAFKDYVQITTKFLSDVSLNELNTADLVVFPNALIFLKCREFTGYTGEGMICQRAIDFTKVGELFSIPAGSKVYVISRTIEASQNAIDELVSMGFSFFQMIPVSFYAPAPMDHSITRAILLGPHPNHFSHLTQVIDIGYPIVSISAIVEIILRLGLPSSLAANYVSKYSFYMTGLLKEFSLQMSHSARIQAFNQALLDNIKNGVCLLNQSLQIVTANRAFGDMLLFTDQEMQNNSIVNLFRIKGVQISFPTLLKEDFVYTNSNGDEIILYAFECTYANLDSFYIINASNGKNISKKAASLRIAHRPPLPPNSYCFSDYISQDAKVMEMLERARRVAQHDSTVLILGESGTGKEILAQGIHYSSPRKASSFVAINFAGMQPELIESELFGYEEGAFTGAKKGGKPGLWEIAHNGTIFLDEIGDAPISLQITLLRVLQEKTIRRVGGHEYIPVDTRVIAATNKNLLDLVHAGTFREDLFYRLNVIPINTIPLRERKGDLFLLFEHFCRIHFQKPALKITDIFTPEMMDFLVAYNWPGNVREVRNICDYFSCIYTGKKPLSPHDLPEYLLQQVSPRPQLLGNAETAILDIIKQNPKIGRMRICSILAEQGITMSEGMIRSTLRSLSEKRLIRINRTR